MTPRKTQNRITALEPKFKEARALEAWHLRTSGMKLQEIAKKLNIAQTVVSSDLRAAAEIVRAQYAEQAETHFEQAIAQIDLVMAALAARIEQSTDPFLDITQIKADIKSELIEEESLCRYWIHGRLHLAMLKADISENSSELNCIRKYLKFGRLDVLAVAQFQKASESKRKLLGLDKDKKRIELSEAAEEIPPEKITDLINRKAEEHRKAREIEVKAK